MKPPTAAHETLDRDRESNRDRISICIYKDNRRSSPRFLRNLRFNALTDGLSALLRHILPAG